jgi:glycosyltransferase involved in cell wall biosynthesis
MNRPKLSIIIASRDTSQTIEKCLTSLETQKDRNLAEIIVVDCSTDGTTDIIKNRFPKVTLLENQSKLPNASLKAIGILVARGEIIVITEPYCIAANNWFSSILKAHDSHYSVISGAVEPICYNNITSWATYFCEYGSFMLPFKKTFYSEVTGNNISYKRDILQKYFLDIQNKGFWKVFLQWKLQETGIAMISDPDILVYHNKHYQFSDFFRKRYYFGRCFSGTRRKEMSFMEIVFYIIINPLLPLIFIYRLSKQIIPKRRYLKEYAASLPLLFLFFVNWSIGELCGYVFGTGNSCENVY